MTTLIKYASGGNYHAGQIVGKTLRLYVNEENGACIITDSGKYVSALQASQTESLLNGVYNAAIESGFEIESKETMLCPVALKETIEDWFFYIIVNP